MRHLLLVFLCVATLPNLRADEGIFADFSTSMGEFTVALDHAAAPRTVANFMGLAEGTRPWVDPLDGSIKSGVPYYDGVIYHRVIAGFMSQTGSRNGQGTDGPGYRFRDELPLTLPHDRHVISMANSGPNTNGAQFFITDMPTPHLNGVHTVFGRVVSGEVVVDAINAVATDAGNRPLTPIVIESVSIRRVGAAAEAFDVTAWDLPVVSPLPGKLEVTPGGPIRYQIDADTPRTFTQAHCSNDLQSWQPIFLRYEDQSGVNRARLDLGTASAPRAFYQLSQSHYPDALPASLANRVLEVTFGGNQRRVFTIHADGRTGTCERTINGSTTVEDIIDTFFSVNVWTADYLFNVVGSGPVAIFPKVRQTNEIELQGEADVFQLISGSWSYIGTGTFTLNK